MRETWRWFGPADTISIPEVRQTGAQGIVSALHHILPGQVWTPDEITKRKREIEQAVGRNDRSGETRIEQAVERNDRSGETGIEQAVGRNDRSGETGIKQAVGRNDRSGETGIKQAVERNDRSGETGIEQAVVPQARSRGTREPSGLTSSGLTWDVVESVPVSEAIKTQTGPVKQHYQAYRQSLRNLADAGLQTVCYNFMPILDWTRTRLAAPQADGATAMHFDLVDFCVFDLHVLKRAGAEGDFPPEILEAAKACHAAMSQADKTALVNNIVAGLPGANDAWTLDDVRAQLATYAAIDADRLRQNLIDFLAEIVPTAEEVGIRLCCHPDDPPFSLLGLPRVMSTLADYQSVLGAVESPANGATLCTGSLGVRADFDPVAFVKALGPKIHFVHLEHAPCGTQHRRQIKLL